MWTSFNKRNAMKYYIFLLAGIITLVACQKQNNYSNNELLCELMYSMIENDQKYRVIEPMTDSLWNLQSEIDDYNCKTLIEIVKQRGWPHKDRFTCEKHTGGSQIFRHADSKYFEQIEALIKKEYKSGRMVAGDYNLIKNHLEGRPTISMDELLKEPIIEE
jgi:hypothetical protein